MRDSKFESLNEIPEVMMKKWQQIVNLVASYIDIPTVLIMRKAENQMEVAVASESEFNPYNVGDREDMAGLYCEAVIKSQKKLLIPNALKDKKWDRNPDIKLGLISYLGYPLNYPNGEPFGTFCILDFKENYFGEKAETLLMQFREMIEADLSNHQYYKKEKSKLETTITKQLGLLLKEKKRAEGSDRLKNLFLSNISHEIRTPMNAIVGFSELLDDSELSESVRKVYIDGLRTSTQKLLDIVEGILSVATKLDKSVQKIQIEEFYLKDFLSQFVSLCEPIAEEKNLSFRLNTDLVEKSAAIKADKEILDVVLKELLENAFKFTSSGFVELGASVGEDEVEMYVKDTGLGVEKENQERIFDQFLQEQEELAKRKGGLGIGLSMAREKIRLLGGNLTLQSEKGKGATFSIKLPIIDNF